MKHLQAALEGAAWEVLVGASENDADLLAKKGNLELAIELQASPDRSRRDALRGRLADAVLVSRAKAAKRSARPVAVLFAPAISKRLAAELADYMQRVAPDVSWGLIDEKGRFEFHGEHVAELVPRNMPDWRVSERPARSPANPFSDLGQWLIKVLLANDVPAKWLRAPRGVWRGISNLADAAGLSQPSASRLCAALESAGFLNRRGNHFELVRIDELLQAWLRAEQQPREQCHARLLLPSAAPRADLQLALKQHAQPNDGHEHAFVPAPSGPKNKRACLSHFAACDALGLGFVKGAPLHVYAEDLSAAALAELELVRVEHPAEADCIVIRPRFPESVFRACVAVEDVPVADALQCWLDVSFHPVRGAEQATEIAARVWGERWSH